MAELQDLEDADRVARKLARLQVKRARVKAEYEAATAKALGDLDHDIKYANERLGRFMARMLEADEDGDPLKPETKKLPCGVELKYRPNPVGKQRLILKDEQAVIEWAKAHEARAVKVTLSVDKEAVRELIEAGTHVEGAYLDDPNWDVFSVSIPKALLGDEAADEEQGA